MAGTILRLRRVGRVAVPLAAGWLLLAGVAQAQSMSTNSASFNAGYGRTADQENSPINVQMGDANGNITLINGVITGAQPGSIFAQTSGFAGGGAGGAIDSFSGAGGASASAIGNNLNVVTQGDNNVVIVNSIQSNTGNVSATVNVNGKP